MRFETVDARGVNLAERSFNVSHTISIGDPANGGMSYTVSYDGGSWRFYSGVWGFARADWMIDPDTMQEHEAWALNYRGRTDVQKICLNSQCDPAGEGIGTFTVELCPNPNDPAIQHSCVKTGYLADGTKLEFDQAPMGGIDFSYSFLRAEIKPNGERLDYHYGPSSVFPISITNNFGYQLRFLNPGPGGAPSAVVLFNMAVDYCDPNAITCPAFTQPWPRLTFEYNGGFGTIGAITETGGARTAYTYGSTSHKMERVIGPGTRQIDIAYQYIAPNFTNCPHQCGHRVSAVSTGGRTWSYTWDNSLIPPGTDVRVTKVTSAVGNVAYDISPGWGLSILPGNPWDFYHISASRIVRVRDEIGRATAIENVGHLNPQVTRVTHPEGNGEEYSYYTYGMLSRIRRFAKPGTGAADQVTTITRGGCCAKPVLIRDARGYVTRNTWDIVTGALLSSEYGLQGPDSNLTCAFGAGLCPKTVYVNAPMSARYFTAPGQLTAGPPIVRTVTASQCELTTTCAAGAEVVTTFGYGNLAEANNLLVRSETVGKPGQTITTSYSYNANGDRTQIDGPRTDVADISRFVWDSDRRLVDEIAADNSATRRTYTPERYLGTLSRGTVNGSGQFTALETTTYGYDGGGNLIRTTRPAGVTQSLYDGANRLRCTAVRMDPADFALPLPDACTVTSPAGPFGPDRITRNTYDAAGQLLKIERGVGTAAAITYATYGVVLPNGQTDGYTLNGKNDWAEDANGNRSDYAYDGFDRLIKLNFPQPTVGAHAANTNDYEQYGYDANNNRTSLRLRSGETINYTIDPLNRESVRDLPNETSADAHSAYDLLNRRRYVRFGGGGLISSDCSASSNGVDYCYDAIGRVTTENAYGRALKYRYDDNVNRTRVTWPDNFYVTYSYDPVNRMDQVRESGTSLLADYAYDNLGRRDGITRADSQGALTDYAYDGASRLISLVQNVDAPQNLTLGFSYNPASQITSRSLSTDSYRYAPQSGSATPYTVNGLNQYASVSGVAYQHDQRGNLKSDGARRYCYDLANRLTRVVNPGVDDPCLAPPLLTIDYDPLGRLRQTTQGATITQFLYSGDQLVAEYDPGAPQPLLRRYVPGAGVDEPLVWYERQPDGSYQRNWLHADHLGSIVAASNSSGALVGAVPYSYSPYGEPDLVNGWGGSRFRYTGQITLTQDANIGLYHYKARVYSPRLGRFLQTDPVGYADNYNLYVYTGNDPLNRFDATGRRWQTAGSRQDLALLAQAREYLRGSARHEDNYRTVQGSRDTYTLRVDRNARTGYDATTKTVTFNPFEGLRTPNGDQTPAIGLGVEVGHAAQNERVGDEQFRNDLTPKPLFPDQELVEVEPGHFTMGPYTIPEETRSVIEDEQVIAGQLRENAQSEYGENPTYVTKGPTSTEECPTPVGATCYGR